MINEIMIMVINENEMNNEVMIMKWRNDDVIIVIIW